MYSVKSGKKNVCQNLDKFKPQDLKYIYANCRDLLQKFGYDYLFLGTEEPQNPTLFIDTLNY